MTPYPYTRQRKNALLREVDDCNNYLIHSVIIFVHIRICNNEDYKSVTL